MSIAYDGPAGISLAALSSQGAVAIFCSCNELPVKLREDEPLAMVKVEFSAILAGLEQAAYVVVNLPGGITFAGQVVESCQGHAGGWLYFKNETENAY